MVSVNGKIIPLTHTICAAAAFLVALIVGYSLHFHKIVENAHYGYPEEWFPSVSATIGDRYPERSLFQILIALTAFPRFLLLLGHYYLNGSLFGLIVGVVRTVTCGGWVYITSTDDHLTHDVFMISYMVLTIPWNIVITKNSSTKLKHTSVASMFYITLFPLIYWYIQHQVHHIPGAYSVYAYFEWALIIFDVTFDSLSYTDFSDITINIGMNADSVSEEASWFFKVKNDAKIEDNSATATIVGIEKEELLENNDSFTTEEIDTSFTQVIQADDSNIEILIEKTEEITYISHLDNPPSYDSYIYIITNLFNSFIFWTTLTALGCSVWHFPLWYMGISGYEASILGYMGSVVLLFPTVPNIIYQYGCLVGGLISIGSYLVYIPESRLLVVCAGAVIIMSYFALTIQSIKSSRINGAFVSCWLLGLVLSVVMKMGFFSNNPIWPIMHEENGGYNKTALIFVTIFGILSPYVNSIHFVGENGVEKSAIKTSFFSKLFIALGFGSMIFAIHQLLTDSSTLIYWSWEGYGETSQGPLPWPWAALSCVVMLLAAFFATFFTGRAMFPTVLLMASTAVLCNKDVKEWNKYIYGGLGYIISMIFLVPTYLSAMSAIDSLWIFALAGFVHDLYILAHVWVTAYAFVPFGWILRESIEVVLGTSTLLIIIGALIANGKVLEKGSALGGKFVRRLLLFVVLTLALIANFTNELQLKEVPQPYHPDSKLITAGIWTIHFGLDNDMWASEDRMIELVREMELDVFGILETDTQHIVMGNRDLTSKMAHELGMYADYGPGPNKHTWGCALFSKFPIINSTHYLLPSPVGELAPAIHATIKTYDDILVDIFVFHSGQEEDVEDRRLQTEELSRLMGSTNRPAILLSYLVTEPLTGNYNTYVSDKSGMYDIDPTDDDRWCEYILFKKLRRTGYARVARGTITDTELQVGKFQVLSDNEVEEYGEDLYSFTHSSEPENEDMKFPDMFLGEGERGHYYHVFDEPRYYRGSNYQNGDDINDNDTDE
ncbi:hypothetical protein Kpol_1046p3 [Vanderwaltozyma polyspora DSM 70294]|uniref:Protein CWH43 n=1 Tax=Vanderwaltozyma polyspora (strain ATCC 22028 / DSM 70294 / BCRC 21397 / CBS 2163 / NBRC 10782 / NRRL Y-8283 / UCD 57-17) TaxID=436907 RepID=A7TRI4_VANPO|nr:uncharacterized protein Kpol_1046p3 [Vanderwaltozyma polyspora DSM 70294]EDO15113.1 hypothetical protein Kpol_1046p3 [Vanderwaltozyma polyspora DSM 70294]